MYDFDHQLFLDLNFDGGPCMDHLMLTVSGTAMWLPLYALILWLVWRRSGWRGVIVFTVLMIAALALADMVSGMFKSNGVLGGLLPGFEPRWRPMFTPSLEGLEIAPDSLRALRMAGTPGDWTVHVPVEAVSGRYGTVSAHAATIVALTVLSAAAIRRRWFTALMLFCTVLICYSRIYLGKHFPMDLVWGTLVGAALGWAAYLAYRTLSCPKKELR
ncbi:MULTISPECIES: phosphatase PAP2 family protein [Alistipes]|uniref:Phosphatase PAP2 family protein n=1 Tax=Alistipes intestinihominis TaxID=3133172 RepID=A0ABV1GTI2_9BACT|nr:phosphatase PAP2 family protein [Alistipes senegalensis]MDY4571391.1 phosphatase PAP2 family protein [Alistipes senegalensis]